MIFHTNKVRNKKKKRKYKLQKLTTSDLNHILNTIVSSTEIKIENNKIFKVKANKLFLK